MYINNDNISKKIYDLSIKDDIFTFRQITELLYNNIDIDVKFKLEENNIENVLAYYNNDSSDIIINYQKTLNYIFNIIKSEIESINYENKEKFMIYNYMILKIFLHEIEHHIQYNKIKNNDLDSEILSLNYKYNFSLKKYPKEYDIINKYKKINKIFKSNLNLYYCIPNERDSEIFAYNNILDCNEYIYIKKVFKYFEKEKLKLFLNGYNSNNPYENYPFKKILSIYESILKEKYYFNFKLYNDKKVEYGLPLTKEEYNLNVRRKYKKR